MNEALKQKLFALREQIKKENSKNKKQKVVNINITDEMLIAMANLVPRSIDEFKVIRGIGDAFIEAYGEQFLAVIQEHIESEIKKPATTKEVEILNKLSNKLVNINQKNRLLYNGRLSQKYAFDLMRLDENKVSRILQSFLNADNKFHVIAKVNYSDKAKASEELNNIKALYRYVETFRVEKGQEVLYLGYPFVEGNLFYEDFKIKAPLFLFPAKMEIVNNEYRLSFDKSRDIVYNTTIILANHKFNHKNEVMPDPVVENLTKENMIQEAKAFFKAHHLNICEDTFALTPFVETNNGSFPKYQDHDLHLKGYCVLGAFPMFSNSLQKDYNDMIENQEISELVQNLFTGIDIQNGKLTFVDHVFDQAEREIDEMNLHYINPLNYSQERVLNELDLKDALVIQGPPGTGKSQTITSLIAQAVLDGKKVLVVSEKKTALDVIYNRLGQIANFVLYIDDPNNKEVFYQRLLSLLEFDDEVTLNHEDINQKAIEINYELGKLVEIEQVLNTETELKATLRELYQTAPKMDLQDANVRKLYQEMEMSSKPKYSLEELVTYQKLFGETNFTKRLLEFKDFQKYETVYQLFKEDLDQADLVIPNNDLLEINFYANIYRKFGWFIRWQLNRKNKPLVQKMKALSLQLAGKQKRQLYQLMLNHGDLFAQALVNYARYEQNLKLYKSLTPGERIYFEYCYHLSQKMNCDFAFVNRALCDLYITNVVTQYESKYEKVLNQTLRYLDIREKISALKAEKEKLTYQYLLNYLQRQIATTFKQYSKRLQELQRKCSAKHKWSIAKLVKEFRMELFTAVQVWLLTPEGVSELLPLDTKFDLVIFDEASQMFIENAIPILHRSKKAIVAGDSKQLRPSKFAVGRIDAEDETYDEYSGVLEEESLLDLAKHRFPEVMLNYHYRSKYEELIAFSNHAFYDGRLYVGPNTKTLDVKPIERIKVNGKWINRQNEVEADEVIKVLKKIFKTRTNETIGIITFNSTQKDLIMDKIEATCLKDAKFNQVIVAERLKDPNEQLFVKNIENVQGDERDIIIFSIGYAPNEHNRIVRQFGWLNNDGGENRLNVAISRAKQKVYVITSIEPFELQVEELKNNGPKLLRRYLEYVKAISDGDRKLAEQILFSLSPERKFTAAQSMNWIKQDLFQTLKNLGYEVALDVGIGSNKVDLALMDPQSKTYLLGIELDDGNAHDLSSTQERDYHRQKYLEAFGWQVHRVWSCDYWRNKEGEINKIVALIKQMAIAS